MDINEIKAYFESNKDNADVQTYINSFKVEPTLEVFKNKLNDADFKSFFDSEKDKHLQKGIETFKTNNLSKMIDEEVKKRFPEADPKDNEIAKLKAEFEKMQKESLRKDLTNKALKVASEKKLPAELVDYFIGQDEESTTTNITKLETSFNAALKTAIEEKLKGGTPSGGSSTQTTYTTNDLKDMTPEQINAIWEKVK